MRNQYLSLVGPSSREPSPGADQPHEKPGRDSRPESSRDPIFDEVAEILERAAQTVEEASNALRAVAGMLRS